MSLEWYYRSTIMPIKGNDTLQRKCCYKCVTYYACDASRSKQFNFYWQVFKVFIDKCSNSNIIGYVRIASSNANIKKSKTMLAHAHSMVLRCDSENYSKMYTGIQKSNRNNKFHDVLFISFKKSWMSYSAKLLYIVRGIDYMGNNNCFAYVFPGIIQ